MQNIDIHVLSMAAKWAEQDDIWLCTVLSTYGSSPRPPGTMMVIKSDGRYQGSLSGGCIEEDFISRIARNEILLATQVIRYGDGGLAPDRALPCGGILDILVEKLSFGQISIAYLRRMLNAISGAETLEKKINLPYACSLLLTRPYASNTLAFYDENTVTLTLASPPRIIIAGLSVVAIYCANFALALGFETLVCESREDMLTNFTDGLESGVKLLRIFPAIYLEKEGCHPGTAIVSLTHDPRIDDLTLMEAVNTKAFYIGAMGSLRNSKRRIERLRDIAELSEDQLNRIHAPIGMSIASKTPAEIALAVMADIVRYKNGAFNQKI